MKEDGKWEAARRGSEKNKGRERRRWGKKGGLAPPSQNPRSATKSICSAVAAILLGNYFH